MVLLPYEITLFSNGRYADKEGITLAEAKKRVKELEIKEYERKVKRYVKDKDFSARANEEWLDYLSKGGTTEEYNKIKGNKAAIGAALAKGIVTAKPKTKGSFLNSVK